MAAAQLFESVSVAPLAGAWIETLRTRRAACRARGVAPLAGAWIETTQQNRDRFQELSRPSRARGLKLIGMRLATNQNGRAPRGRVD